MRMLLKRMNTPLMCSTNTGVRSGRGLIVRGLSATGMPQ
ncbi:MAG: hypothetical protein QOI16_2553 [Pseudonocardiales bacterium]|nr:hypothetical protein [Pseudonocardiales bacterium]